MAQTQAQQGAEAAKEAAIRKVVAAVERQRKQSLSEAVSDAWRARDAVIVAAHELYDAYSATSK
jgi:hypothetical protein